MKKVVFTFGRMNPPTVGHQKLVDKIISEARKEKADSKVFLSHTQNNKKDPLNYAEKIRFARKGFGKIIEQSKSKTIIQVLQELQKAGYTDAILVVGSDRVTEFSGLLNKYNGGPFSFDSIDVRSAGARDPDAEGVEGMSASKLRALAIEGEFDTFKTGLPKKLTDKDAKDVYDTIRSVIKEDLDEERKPLSISQRKAIGRRMKKLAPKLQRIKKMKAKKMANTDVIKKRAQKAAIQVVRKKVAGDRGTNYKNLSPSDKIQVDRLVQKKSAMVQKLAKKLIPATRKKELSRLKSLRGGNKTESFDSLFESIILERQDSDIKDREGSQPAKYHSGLAKSTKTKRDTQFQKGAEKDPSDPSAYPDKHVGDGDAKTRTSKHTKKYRDMFGEAEVDAAKAKIEREKKADAKKHDRMMDRARTTDTKAKNKETNETFNITESAETALRKKADKTGIPYGILKKVYDRGMAAWRTGHRPGANQQQWAFARVNSFATKGKGTWGKADKDLADKVRSVKEEVDLDETPTSELIAKIKSNTVQKKKYTAAAKVMNDIIKKKKAVAKKKGVPVRHGNEYYAGQIARQYELNPQVLRTMAEEILSEELDENLRKQIAQMASKFPEGSKVRMKHDGKVAKVLSVGKDFVKVAVGNKTMEHKPSEIEPIKEDGGAGREGTKKLLDRYKKDTPCQECADTYEDLVVEAAEYQGRKVDLNNPFRLPSGSKKKFGVYVKNDKGNVIKVTFGDPNMEIKRDDPKRRASFRARHDCANKKDKTKAGYWSCYQWRAGSKVDN